MREVSLPSGAVLGVAPSPFAISKVLYQAIIREIQRVPISNSMQWHNVLKDFFCIGYSSLEVEKSMLKCFERCTYNGEKLTEDCFESVEARQDYLLVCSEVTKENVAPFVKNLYAEWRQALAAIQSIQS